MTESQPPQQRQPAPNPGPGTPVIVDVHAEIDSSGEVQCQHEWRFENGPNRGKGAIDVPARQNCDPGTPIHFHLRDRTGRTLRFDQDDPIWVSRVNCPDKSCEDPEIPRDSIQASPKLLKVMDRNNDKCELHYNLRFKDEAGQTAEYDPAIRNGGKVS